jgi:radical SAM protein with 4Fe4S-binding SPASM domain
MLDTLELIKKYGMVTYQDRGNRKISPTHIRFYGGEPMLFPDKIKFFVETAKAKGFNLTYTIMSNGTVMTPEFAQWMKDNKIHIQRSIDGCAEAQEMTRPGSMQLYDKVTEMVHDEGSSRRMTIMPETAHLLMKSIRELEAKGFNNGGFSPIPNYYVEWKPEQVDDFIRQLWEAADYFIETFKTGRKPMYLYYFSRESASRFGTLKTQYACGAGKGLHCITYDGYIMLCHRFANETRDSQFCYGTVKDALNDVAKGYGQIVPDRLEEVKKNKWIEKCKTCIAQFGCEKGCYHSNWVCSGNLREPPDLYCRLRQESAKMVAYIDNKLRHIDPYWWVWDNPRYEAKKYKEEHKLIRGETNGRRSQGGERRYFIQGHTTESKRSNFNKGSGSRQNNSNRKPVNTLETSAGTNRQTGINRFCS